MWVKFFTRIKLSFPISAGYRYWKRLSADTETDTDTGFSVSAKPKFRPIPILSAESRYRMCFGRTLIGLFNDVSIYIFHSDYVNIGIVYVLFGFLFFRWREPNCLRLDWEDEVPQAIPKQDGFFVLLLAAAGLHGHYI